MKNETKKQGASLKTLLVTDMVDSTKWTQELGDERMAALFQLHDRVARDLLDEYEGREADRTDGFLLLFERPIQAVCYAFAFHQAMDRLSRKEKVELRFRVGIHLGEVVLIETSPEDIARGAKPLEVEGLAKPTAARLMSLAMGGQTLLSRSAFELARHSAVGKIPAGESWGWLNHGKYRLKGVDEPMEIREVGVEGLAPLEAPADSEKVHRVVDEGTVLGWRPAEEALLPGRPHWRMDKKLGEGGIGEVWLGVHTKTGARRVFKFCYEARSLRSLQREITLFRLLKEELGEREDISPILDWNFEQAPYYIESEYTEAGDLIDWTQKQGGLSEIPLAARLEVVAQLAEALAAAHSVGVLHKDIKPANVLIRIDRKGRVQAQLADFGIGRLLDPERLAAVGITDAGLTELAEGGTSYSGTRLYMAPEVLEGKSPTLQADVYGLAVVLYQVVVGDFSRALAPGWEQDVEDELLREDIAWAGDGAPRRRLGNAVRLAERLRSLDERRAEREAEERSREEARQVRAALAQSRKRRRMMVAVIAVLALFGGAMSYHANSIAREKERAEREARVAQEVSDFMVNLFEVSDPGEARGNSVTARELLDQGAEKIPEELTEQPLTQARLMHTIGRVYQTLGLYKSAAPLLEEALAIREKHLESEHPDVAQSLNDLAYVYAQQGRHEEAESLYKRALTMRENILGSKHSDVASTLNHLAILYLNQGRYTESETLFQKSLAIREKLLEPEHSDRVSILNNLASLYVSQGRYEEAESLYKTVLAISEKVLPPEHPDLATNLNNLGDLYQQQGRYGEAKPLFQRALAIWEKVLGPAHPMVGGALGNIANLSLAQGKYEEAEPLFLRSLEIIKKATGPEHFYVAIGLNNLADLYNEQERHAKAEPLYLRALAIGERAVGEEHPWMVEALSDLAELYRRQGRYEEAEPIFHRSVTIGEKVLDPDHLDLAKAYHGLATLYRDQERYTEAESHYQRALAIREKTLVSEHPELRKTREAYATLLRSAGREAEARELVDLPNPPIR
jgi:tetratricopeptide (TPR) repeat protein/class 3 adenylate cyclase